MKTKKLGPAVKSRLWRRCPIIPQREKKPQSDKEFLSPAGGQTEREKPSDTKLFKVHIKNT